MVEHLSYNPKVPGLIQDPVSYRGRGLIYDEACFMHLPPVVVHNFRSVWVYRVSVPYAQQDPRFLFKKRSGQPREFLSLISS